MKRSLALVVWLTLVTGCSPMPSSGQLWQEAATEWTKDGVSADARLKDYQECHLDGVKASTRNRSFDYGRHGRRSYGRRGVHRTYGRSANELSQRVTTRNAIFEACMAARGWTMTTGPTNAE